MTKPNGSRKMKAEVAILCGIVVASLLLLVIYQGIVASRSNAEGDGPLSVKMDFGGRVPDSWPNSITVWQYLEGSLYLQEQSGSERTIYVVIGLPFVASPFELLLEAGDMLGITISFERYINGAFVTSIDGVRNGPGNAGWTYYVNSDPESGSLIPLAADLFALKTGDEVLWHFSE